MKDSHVKVKQTVGPKIFHQKTISVSKKSVRK